MISLFRLKIHLKSEFYFPLGPPYNESIFISFNDKEVQHPLLTDCVLYSSCCFSTLRVIHSLTFSYDSGVIGAANLFIPYSIPSYSNAEQ